MSSNIRRVLGSEERIGTWYFGTITGIGFMDSSISGSYQWLYYNNGTTEGSGNPCDALWHTRSNLSKNVFPGYYLIEGYSEINYDTGESKSSTDIKFLPRRSKANEVCDARNYSSLINYGEVDLTVTELKDPDEYMSVRETVDNDRGIYMSFYGFTGAWSACSVASLSLKLKSTTKSIPTYNIRTLDNSL